MVTPEKPQSKRYLIVVVVVLLTLVAVAMLSKTTPSEGTDCSNRNLTVFDSGVQLNPENKKKFNLEYAKTASQQELGLSDRPCLPANSALVFLFPTDDRFGIWMKGMRFPIDVIWLDASKHIVTIQKDMEPSTYPKVFYPDNNARYVIEVNKGDADSMGATLGAKLSW